MFDIFVVFFKQKTAYEMRISDWSSDVCSSDLDFRLSRQSDQPSRSRPIPEIPMSADTTAVASPNDLSSNWLPFTPNRQFKREPRLIARARDISYFKPDGTEVLDATAGLWCCNAGHCREPIVKAIQTQAGERYFAPPFQFG